MTNPVPEFFRYCRSKRSAFGHRSRIRDPVKAWLETKEFLDSYTTYELSQPSEITLRVTDGEYDHGFYEDIVSIFGQPIKIDEQWIRWRTERKFDPEINMFIQKHFKYNPSYEYNLNIQLNFTFFWKVIDKKILDENSEVFSHFSKKGDHGHFWVSINNRLFIQPEFVVPFASWSKLHDFTSQLINDLPFKFDDKAFISFYTEKLKSGKTRYKSIGNYSENP